MARYVEIDSLEAFDNAGAHATLVIQELDLTGRTAALLERGGDGLVLLGCRLDAAALAHVQATGGLVFPPMPALPFRPYRAALYTPDELMVGYRRGHRASFLTDTADAAIYNRYKSTGDCLVESLAQRLHDLSIDDAVAELIERRSVVGIMGGHGMKRTEPAYAEVVRLARALTRRGFFVVTGGGPGAMEAGNLGAWLAPHDDDRLERALGILAAAAKYTDDPWLDTAYEARNDEPGGDSLAIPTWFYGHEPTNLFAGHVAKYFSNSLREDGLLAISTHGVVFAPGSAGTVQEIFQDAAQNHYGTFDVVSPMVLLNRDYWTTARPVLPLLKALSAGRRYAERIALVDGWSEAVDRIAAWPPVPYGG